MKCSAFIIFIGISFFSSFIINAQKIINLYPSSIPNAKTTMHVYSKSGHGFIFGQPGWIDSLLLWMKKNKWTDK